MSRMKRTKVGGVDTDQKVATIVVTPNPLTAPLGLGTQLFAALFNVKGQTLTNRSVVWQTSDLLRAFVTQTGLLTAVALGSCTVTAIVYPENVAVTVPVSVVVATPQLMIASYNAISPSVQIKWFVCDNTSQTVNGGGLLTAWDDLVRPGQGFHARPPAEAPGGALLTAGKQMAGLIELPGTLGLTGGSNYHGDAHTLANSLIPGMNGLAAIFSDRSAGITYFGVAKLVNGRQSIQVGEDADVDVVKLYGDDTGNVQALHVSTQWTKAQDANIGSDPMHWSITITQTAEPEGVDGSHSSYWSVYRYCRDIVQISLFTSGNPMASGRRFRLGLGTSSASSAHYCAGIVQGNPTAAHTKLFNDWAAQRWPTLYEDIKRIGYMFGNSYMQPIQVQQQRFIAEGENGRPAIANFGMTNSSFFGHRPPRHLFPFMAYFLSGCDWSKRPATGSVAISFGEYINGSNALYTTGTQIVDQNFSTLDYVKAMDPARVRSALHDEVYCCSTPFDQRALNVPLLTDYLAAHAVNDGHAQGVVTYLDSVVWNPDPYMYGTGDVDRRTLAWDAGIHRSSRVDPLWRGRDYAMFKVALGETADLTSQSNEIYSYLSGVQAPHVDLVGVGSKITPTWQTRNYKGVPLTGKTYSFSSEHPQFATVNALTGEITAVANGDAWIICISGDGGYGVLVAHVTGAP